jgi:tetratricopeptide (TPR) repeat protein
MKNLILALLVFTSGIASGQGALAQDKAAVKALIDRGIALNDSGKYAEAIDKYKEALMLDKESLRAQYEMAYTLSVSGKPKEAIPILEKLAPSNVYPEAYNMLGDIYDDANDFEKSLAYYKQGLIVFPKNQKLHFNLAVSYLRQKKNAEAELEAIEAIKLDPKHASSQRVYGIATYRQNKRGCSLLAWCSFLILEPQTKRSAEAYNFVKAIINYGIKQTGEKSVTITISDTDLGSGNLLMPMAVTNATNNKKNLTSVDSLALQLTELFKISTTITGEKQTPFVINYFAKYFEKLGNSDHMPAFARLVSLSAYKDENLKWFKENDKQLTELDSWVALTERNF